MNEQVMIKRIDQQIKVNKLMISQVDLRKIENIRRKRYMLHYIEIITAVSSILLIRSGAEENLKKKTELWRFIRDKDLMLYSKQRIGVLGMTSNLPGRAERHISLGVYKLLQKRFGFN